MSLIDPDGRFAKLIQPVIEAEGFDLVRVVYMSSDDRANILEVMVEPQSKDGDLNLDMCAKISREISAVLDVEDPINSKYRLEVGSPGIDRPLTREKDFERFKGFEAKIELHRPVETGQKRFKGVLKGVNDNIISLETEDGLLETEINEIHKARLVFSEDLMTALKEKQV